MKEYNDIRLTSDNDLKYDDEPITANDFKDSDSAADNQSDVPDETEENSAESENVEAVSVSESDIL